MALKQKYSILDRFGAWRLVMLYLLFVLLFMSVSTFARYDLGLEGAGRVELANFKFFINNVEVSSNSGILSIDLTSRTTDPDAQYPQGYFFVEINPAGTEVSFEYSIKIVNSDTSSNIRIDNYSIGSETAAKQDFVDNVVSGRVLLSAGAPFTKADTVKIYYFWSAVEIGAEPNRRLNFEIKLKQYMGQ